jgi:hypothetical protein
METRRSARGGVAGPRVALCAAGLVVLAAIAACHAARVLAPPPPLRAASAALYAVDVEFAEPLDRASAQDPSRYAIYPPGIPASRPAITSATLIDTLYGRTVQLLMPSWFGDSTVDRVDMTVETNGVRAFDGASTGLRSVTFRTGLGYASPMQALFDSRCSACHGASRADGSYRTDGYSALFGNGVAPPADVIAGDPKCLTVVKCKPRNSMFNAASLSYLDFEMIRNWVEVYSARP